MIRVMVGDTRGPYGFYALDETDPTAKVVVTGYEYEDGRSKRTARMMERMLIALAVPGETPADVLRALPTRLTS
jgi:hypothetical protein